MQPGRSGSSFSKPSFVMVCLAFTVLLATESLATTDLPAAGPRMIELAEGRAMTFIWIPPGTFRMGNSPDDPPDPAHSRWYNAPFEVKLTRGFWLSTTEVTQATWQAVMGTNPSYHLGDHLPVHNVSWDDAQAFLAKAGSQLDLPLRLPTEAEWEYAARAGVDRSKVAIAELGWTRADGISAPRPVATRQPSAWGLYDMFGNVNEWCQDFYGPYPNKPQTDWSGPTTGRERVVRGGSYTGRVRHANPSDRGFYDQPQPWVGFRIALSGE